MRRFLIALLIVVSAVGLCLTGACKKKHDFSILGQWQITVVGSTDNDGTRTFSFSGDGQSGNVSIEGMLSSGDYTVTGDTVVFRVTYGIASPHFAENFSGTIVNDDFIRGDFTVTFNEAIRDHGTFTAAR